jgi:acyl transferase domain-containing protein
MLSPHGRCHTFDDRADGFVPGEGVGVVVLKRLSHALADGDHVLGVIRGSGINQDGATNGITAPSALSQERLETEVYEKFGVDPAQIQMVEAHGTGTKLGDPIEYRALTQSIPQVYRQAAVLRDRFDQDQPGPYDRGGGGGRRAQDPAGAEAQEDPAFTALRER